jgi:hypothetical protein
MFLKVLGHIPLLQSLTSFPVSSHKAAARKFAVLYVLTNLPVIFAAVLSPVPTGETAVLANLATKLREALSISELFVYTAVFLTPVMYLIFERYSETQGSDVGERIREGFRGLFRGYALVSFVSFLTLLLTAVAFSSIKLEDEKFKHSFLNHYLVEYSIIVYLFALYCWYLTLLDEKSTGDFVDATRRDENTTASAFSVRVKEKGEAE